MVGKGWFNLEAAQGIIPETQYFEGDSAFSMFNLSRTTRLYGWAACTGIGFVLCLLGAIFLLLGFTVSFALMYVLGTVVSLVGTGFIIGFFRQLKLMFKPVRILATIVLFVSIGLIFVGAFVLSSGLLCIIFVVIQYLAYIWYNLSYIPYARTAVLRTLHLAT